MVVQAATQALCTFDFRVDGETPVPEAGQCLELGIRQIVAGRGGIGKKCQRAFRRQLRIKLTQAAGGAVAWVDQWFFTPLPGFPVNASKPARGM